MSVKGSEHEQKPFLSVIVGHHRVSFSSVLSGCFVAPQRAFDLRFVDADTNFPLQQVAVTPMYKAWGTSMPGMLPIIRVHSVHSSMEEESLPKVDEEYKTILPGRGILQLEKTGYQRMRVESTVFGICIENIDSTEGHKEFLGEPTATIRFSKDRRTSSSTEISAAVPKD